MRGRAATRPCGSQRHYAKYFISCSDRQNFGRRIAHMKQMLMKEMKNPIEKAARMLDTQLIDSSMTPKLFCCAVVEATVYPPEIVYIPRSRSRVRMVFSGSDRRKLLLGREHSTSTLSMKSFSKDFWHFSSLFIENP